MITLTKPQRVALHTVWQRERLERLDLTYRAFRRLVRPGPGCIMIPFAGMQMGIEPDGNTHS